MHIPGDRRRCVGTGDVNDPATNGEGRRCVLEVEPPEVFLWRMREGDSTGTNPPLGLAKHERKKFLWERRWFGFAPQVV